MFNNKLEIKLLELDVDFLKVQLDKDNNGFVMVHTYEHGTVCTIENNKVDNDFIEKVFDIEGALKLIEEERKTMRKLVDDFSDTFFISLKPDVSTGFGRAYKAKSFIIGVD